MRLYPGHFRSEFKPALFEILSIYIRYTVWNLLPDRGLEIEKLIEEISCERGARDLSVSDP
jgi:hypothetical protein